MLTEKNLDSSSMLRKCRELPPILPLPSCMPLSLSVLRVSHSSERTLAQLAALMMPETNTIASASTVSAMRMNRLRMPRII